MDEVELFVNECLQSCRKIRARIPQDTNVAVLNYPDDVLTWLTDSFTHLEKAAKMLREACNSAGNQVTLMPDIEGLNSTRISELLQEGAEKVYGKMQDKSVDDFLKYVFLFLFKKTFGSVGERITSSIKH